jgi:hypothetical protein
MTPSERHVMILSSGDVKRVTARNRLVHRRHAACAPETCDIPQSVAQNPDRLGSLHRNRSILAYDCSTQPMKRSFFHLKDCKLEHPASMQRLPRNAGRALIWIYRHTLSPLVGYNCRHLPTCSVYGDEAIERFGLWAGGWMTLARVLRCQPWGTSGIDNVPLEAPPEARWYLPWRFGRWRGINAPP